CPDDWVVYDVKCYRFVLYPEYAHDAARAHCGENGASLLGINTLGEHQFVSDWLMTNDLSRYTREFYTSGLIRNLEEGDLVWESDGSRIPPGLQFWLSDEDRQDVGQFITYKYGVTAYGWSRAPSDTPLPFICEISTEEAYKITEEKRDFDYGLNITDPNEVPRGPKFTKEPRDVMLVTGIKSAVMDCAAFANPSPTYKMYKTMGDTGETILITPDVDTRYALTNGMLTIVNPTESLDSGQYYCEVSNTYGTVLSQTGTISFGELAEFSNVQREKVRVQEYHYGVIDCMPPNFRPAVAFGWMKSSPGNFLRTDLMLHLFPSYNGKLYFSEVGSSDAAAYFCMVKLMPFRGTEFGTDQPPARVSLPIEMEVTDSWFKLLYSTHNTTQTPHRLANGLFNCSVSYYHTFQQHLRCNLKLECSNAEDEIGCPYTTKACGLGFVDVGRKCYYYHPSKKQITWYDAHDYCRDNGMFLVSPQTPKEWHTFKEILKLSSTSYETYLGLWVSDRHRWSYREVWQWADGSFAYFNLIHVAERLPKPMCSMVNILRSPFAFESECAKLKFISFIVCEKRKDSIPNTDVQLHPSTADSNFTRGMGSVIIVKCPQGHYAKDFLSCDQGSRCGVQSYVTSCRLQSGEVPMFVCDRGFQTLHYTLVCDHRQDCLDGSDEKFCRFEACPDRQCHNKQCVKADQWCDSMRHCVDDSDELCPGFVDPTPEQRLLPPAVVHFDGHGGYSLTPLMPINYEWWREGLPMPPTVEFLEENRVMVIDAAQIEDSGTYWCRASRGAAGQGGSFDEKSVRLNIAVPGDIEISANVLTILRPDAAKHDGMYQCRSSNGHGTVYSTGQLRVLGFAPSFAKNPVLSKTMGAVAGSVTIACSPEAAPKPTITWLRNGSPVGSTDPNARVLVLSNGNIVISQLATSDAGIYTCRAENSHGWASSDGVLQGSAGGISGLYIQGAQRQHSGSYTCRAKTTFDTVVANATLSVRGPPGEPAGLIVERRTEGLQEDAVTLQWTPGATWGGVITYYTVQAATNFNDTWRIIAENIPASSTQVPNRDRLETDITNLNPFTGYRFRISARNVYGHGPYSLPTTFYQTPVAPPRRAPVNITAGEGKVGDLNITWVPIPPEEQGGRGFGYNEVVGDVKAEVVLVGQEFFYTQYDVKVQAFNDAGPGPNSSVVTIYSAED
ncbi:hypothetical protein BaRGS_00026687, partial [Batillaria attramentaria]